MISCEVDTTTENRKRGYRMACHAERRNRIEQEGARDCFAVEVSRTINGAGEVRQVMIDAVADDAKDSNRGAGALEYTEQGQTLHVDGLAAGLFCQRAFFGRTRHDAIARNGSDSACRVREGALQYSRQIAIGRMRDPVATLNRGVEQRVAGPKLCVQRAA